MEATINPQLAEATLADIVWLPVPTVPFESARVSTKSVCCCLVTQLVTPVTPALSLSARPTSQQLAATTVVAALMEVPVPLAVLKLSRVEEVLVPV